MDKEQYLKEAYFNSVEDMEGHLALAARIKASMDKTISTIARTKQEVYMTEMTDQELKTRYLLLEEAKFEHQRKMDEENLACRRQELACWISSQKNGFQQSPWSETP